VRSRKFLPVQEGRLFGLEFYEIFLIMLGFVLVFKNKWICDDGYIYFRYVDNFVIHKIGLVFNAHEYVEGFTGILWTFLLSGIRFFLRTIPLRHIVFVIGFFLASITFSRLAALNRRLIRASRGDLNEGRRLLLNFSLPLALAVSTRVIPEYFTSGMETPLVMLYAVFVAGQILLPSESVLTLGILAGAGPLVRPEFSLLSLGLILHFIFFARKKGVIKAILIAAVPNAAYIVFRIWYYASVLPNTFFTKESSGSNLKQGFNYLLDLIKAYRSHVVFGLFLLATLAAAKRAGRPLTRNRIFLACLIVLFGGYVIWVGGDFMHGRFWLPVLMMLYAGFSGLPELLFSPLIARLKAPAWTQRFFSFVLVLIVVLALLPMRSVSRGQDGGFEGISNEREWFLEFDGRSLSDWNFEPRNSMVKQAVTLKTISKKLNLPVSIAHSMIGYLGYYAGPRVQIIDRLGLTDAVGSRVRLYQRGIPGHEKWVPLPYLVWRRSAFWLTPFDDYNYLFHVVPHLDPLTELNPAFLDGLGRIFKKDIRKKSEDAIQRLLSVDKLEPNLVFFLKELTEPYPDLNPDLKKAIEDRYKKSAKGKASWELWLGQYEKDLDTIRAQTTNKHNFLENVCLALKTLTLRFDNPS